MVKIKDNTYVKAFKGVNLDQFNNEDLGSIFHDAYKNNTNFNIKFPQSWGQQGPSMNIVRINREVTVPVLYEKRDLIIKNGVGIDTTPKNVGDQQEKQGECRKVSYYPKDVPQPWEKKTALKHRVIKNVNGRSRSCDRIRSAAKEEIPTKGGFKGTISVHEKSYEEDSVFARSLTGFCYGDAKDAFRVFIEACKKKAPSPDNYGGYILNEFCDVTLTTTETRNNA